MITLMAAVSISLFHSEFGNDIPFSLVEGKTTATKHWIYLCTWKKKQSKWDVLFVCLTIWAWHLDQVTWKSKQNER